MFRYQVRYSKLAKHLQLKISHRGLEVVVPMRRKLQMTDIEQFVNEKRGWIERNCPKYDLDPFAELKIPALPTSIDLLALNKRWEVRYLPSTEKKVQLHANLSDQITLLGNISKEHLCLHVLRQWILQQGNTFLHHELTVLSQSTGLTFEKFSIRLNQTRWGSCSHNKHITACCKLLFVPITLVRHVLLHELCHTKVMNHGRKFWKLLLSFDPDGKSNAKALHKASFNIPKWL